MSPPMVSMVLAAHNAEDHLPATIASLGRVPAGTEFIFIDDGSTDRTAALLGSFLGDRPGRVLFNRTRRGLAASLNRGIEAARGRFVARMDADDLYVKGRIEAQSDFLDRHPDYVVVGTGATLFGSGRKTTQWAPRADATIRARIGLTNPLIHPTVMIRRHELLRVGYDEAMETSQDYDLWARLADVGKMSNLPMLGVRLRRHAYQTSHLRRDRQASNSATVMHRWAQARGYGDDKVDVWRHLAQASLNPDGRLSPDARTGVIDAVSRTMKAVADQHDAPTTLNTAVYASRFLRALFPALGDANRLARILSGHAPSTWRWARDVASLATASGRRAILQGPIEQTNL